MEGIDRTSEQRGKTGGDESALERDFMQAHDDYAGELFRHCVLRVRDRELAKDLVQETFTRTWDYLARGKSIGHMRAFLYRTLQNATVDAMRKKRSASLDAMQEETGFDPPDESHEPTPEVRHDARAALRLLGELDDRYRTAIIMRYVDGLSPREIAEVLSVTENVVSVRIHRGLKQLRELGAGTFSV